MMDKNLEYRQMLNLNLQRRQAANRSYSLRAFARDLKISPTSLSLIFSGKQGISISKATHICEVLNLTSEEKSIFLLSVESSHGRSQAVRKAATKKLFVAKNNFKKSQDDSLLTEWLFIPILEYLRNHSDCTLLKLSKVFNISSAYGEIVTSSLIEKKVLSYSRGKWRVHPNYLSFGGSIPSVNVRQFHKESMARAVQSMEEQSLNDRIMSSTIFSINPKLKEAAFKELLEFRRKFCIDNSAKEKEQDAQVYCLGIQFFRTHKEVSNEL